MVIPVTLLTGYLGAGKTTLLNNILRNNNGFKTAVIVNDIGEVNIDADMIANGGLINDDKGIVPLQNGCICCTLKEDLIKQLISIINMHSFDHIVIEASGVCEPLPIAQTISLMDGSYEKTKKIPRLLSLDNIVTVVDANRMATEFSGADDLVKENIEEDDIENLLIQQIEFCNTIILNKIDMVSEEQKKNILAIIKALQPTAKIIECKYCDVNLSEIMDVNLFSLREAEKTSGWAQALLSPEENEETGETDEYGISTFVYRSRKPFEMDSFDKFVQNNFPKTVIRSKGLIWFKEDDTMAYMFEQSGQEMFADEFGQWICTYDKATQDKVLKSSPKVLEKWDDECGDKRIELVFIGKNMNKEEIEKQLDNCLYK